jgi:hypothetical protein
LGVLGVGSSSVRSEVEVDFTPTVEAKATQITEAMVQGVSW